MSASLLTAPAFRRASARRAGRASRPAFRLGCDLCAIATVQHATANFGSRYLQRIFTPHELRDCQSEHGWRFCSLAARFAAKEATMKVLRLSPEQALPWSDIEIRRDRRGAPQLFLKGRASALARQAALADWCVSLSHEADYACATVLAVTTSRPRKPFHEPS